MFKNAYEGIKKLYMAEILVLFAGIFAVVSSAITFLTTLVFSGDILTALGIAGICVLIAGVVMIVAFILNVIGLVKARRDEPAFNKALVLTFVGIAISLASSIFSADEVATSYINTASSVISLLITIFVVQGVINLAVKLGNEQVAQRGVTVLRLIVTVQLISIVASLISVILRVNAALVVAGVLALIASILSIVYYFIYLSLLNKAKKMLAVAE